jgi:class 3 adenylate cyclase
MGAKTRFVRHDGARLAYQVYGDGPVDLVFVPGIVSHVELQWADPLFARFLRRLGSWARVIVYDKRGVGMSDRVADAASAEQHASDLAAVMRAAGSDRAVILGFSEGASAAVVHAAAFPHQVLGLILVAAYLRTAEGADIADRAYQRTLPLADRWGEGVVLELTSPSLAGSKLNLTNCALFERAAMSTEMVRSLIAKGGPADLSDVLRSVQAPTLMLHRRDDFVPVDLSRAAVRLLPHGRLVELDGGDHVPFAGDVNALLVHVEDFLRSVAADPRPVPEHGAVVFTDIADSTATLVSVGDRRWRDLVAAHDDLTMTTAQQCGGEALQSTGDGWLAVFPTATAAVRYAWSIVEQMPRVGLQMRAGVHAGPIERDNADLRGLTVHAAARVTSRAKAGEVLVSADAVRLCADAAVPFERRGSFALKGLPGRWVLHRVAGEPRVDPPAAAPEQQPRLDLPDRAMVTVARRAPAVARALGRLARPTGVPSQSTQPA